MTSPILCLAGQFTWLSDEPPAESVTMPSNLEDALISQYDYWMDQVNGTMSMCSSANNPPDNTNMVWQLMYSFTPVNPDVDKNG